MKLLSELEEKYFKEITQINAISGNEIRLTKYLEKEYKKLNLELIKDNLGNILGYKKGSSNKLKVLIDAHMDEVGFIVKDILPNGLIKPYLIGGFNLGTLESNRITLTNSLNKEFKGCILSISPHDLKRENIIKEDLIMDFGFNSKEEVLKNNINIGDMITLDGNFEILNDSKIMSKAIDNRYGIILGLTILNELKDYTLPFDLYVGGSVMEEVGLRGIGAIYENIKPDFAFILDCSSAKDYLADIGKIGDGVLLRFIDGGMIANKKLLEYQKEAIINTNGKYQYFETLGNTNASKIHLFNVMTLTHCISGRQIHTNSTIIDINDFIYAKNSLIYMLKNLNYDKYIEFKESKY